MLSPKTQYNLVNAKEYFAEHLSSDDYYTEGEMTQGRWFGMGASDLQLSGEVKATDFLNLCDNIHPRTGAKLTQRFKTTRMSGLGGETLPNRRVFFDFTISPPKSVSISSLIGNDKRILSAHDQAILMALNELEKFASTRVRISRIFSNRNTSNLVCATFRHHTSRALDPHLHTHCIIFNATHDPVENRWKALENSEMLRAQKFVENVYYHELAKRLHTMGYEIENKPRGDFEIKGIPNDLLLKFSKRHHEIDAKTAILLENKPSLGMGNIQTIRENIAHKERARKVNHVSNDDLQTIWNGQISDHERQILVPPQNSKVANMVDPGTPAKAASWAEDHLFDRRSVVPEHDLWRYALEYARGEPMSIEALQKETQQRAYIRQGGLITTKEVLEREQDIVRLAKEGIGRFPTFCPNHSILTNSLDEDQRKAAVGILHSKDFITLFRGGAGTGKSFALKEVRKGLLHVGYQVRVLAPQRQQVTDLGRDGFSGAQTVSEFLAGQTMESGDVIIVDEAGQMGAKQMHALLNFAQEKQGRLILSGDTRQHGAVEASDALRALEKHAFLQAVELHAIRRQNPARGKSPTERMNIRRYRRAVKAASMGQLTTSFDLLNRHGAILACSPGEQQTVLAKEYVALTQKKCSLLVISQTWAEVHSANESIRSSLKAAGLLGKKEKRVQSFSPKDLTTAQKRDRRFYGNDAVVVFNRRVGEFKTGQVCKFVDLTDSKIVLETEGIIQAIPLRLAECVSVFRKQPLSIAAGDKLQLKANGNAIQGDRLSNGEVVTVESVTTGGEIKLTDGRILGKNFRQFVRGFAVTSYGSQGKTVDYVLFSDSAIKAATNRQQWYVTISRGRRGIRIFTTDKQQLRESIRRSGDRTLALDLHPQAVGDQKTNMLGERV